MNSFGKKRKTTTKTERATRAPVIVAKSRYDDSNIFKKSELEYGNKVSPL
jgi:hypothetical protein